MRVPNRLSGAAASIKGGESLATVELARCRARVRGRRRIGFLAPPAGRPRARWPVRAAGQVGEQPKERRGGSRFTGGKGLAPVTSGHDCDSGRSREWWSSRFTALVNNHLQRQSRSVHCARTRGPRRTTGPRCDGIAEALSGGAEGRPRVWPRRHGARRVSPIGRPTSSTSVTEPFQRHIAPRP